MDNRVERVVKELKDSGSRLSEDSLWLLLNSFKWGSIDDFIEQKKLLNQEKNNGKPTKLN